MNDTGNSTTTPLRVFIFDGTRLRSHLFFRYLSTSPQFGPIYHPFLMAAMFGKEHIYQHMHHSEMRRKEVDEDLKHLYGDDTFTSCRQQFSQAVADVEKRGKIVLSNEHWFNVMKTDVVLDLLRKTIVDPLKLGDNPTHLPDQFFNTLRPVLLIRHPALSINSIYRDALIVTKQRPGDEDFEVITMNQPIRILFDYFKARNMRPIVVDAEDILWRTEELITKLCSALGAIDASSLTDDWEPLSEDEIQRLNPIVYALTKNIQHSSGIERPATKPEEPSISKAYEGWTEKYGSAISDQLKGLAEDNMPHYEYLKQFKI